MNDVKKLLARIGTARDAISRKEEQTSLDFMIDGVLMNCSVLLKEQEAVVRCKDCKHRPKEPNLETYENGFDIEFPEDSKCPCQCSSDRYYSWCPDDDWFCADGERRTK